jgi:ribose-phosphate pyrophosphokinase
MLKYSLNGDFLPANKFAVTSANKFANTSLLLKSKIMLQLNLIHPQASDIAYKTLIFPDGQPHIVLNFDKIPQNTEGVNIIARITNPTDLFTVLMAKDVLDAQVASSLAINIERIDLTISYLMAARMDRQMTDGEPFSLRIVAAMLNQAGFRHISIFDPHSDVSTALILRSKAIGNESFVSKCLEHFYQNQERDDYALISPDAGALKKIYKVAQFVDAPLVVECSKIRDVKTGHLSGFNTQVIDFQGKTCFIVDDICDGGGTFVGLAALLKSRNAGKIVLIVSHGIFSKGFDLAGIDAIYTTDSFRDFKNLPNHVVVFPFNP